MNVRCPLRVTVVLVALELAACGSPQYYWGSYEDSLYKRCQRPGDTGVAEALSMLQATIA